MTFEPRTSHTAHCNVIFTSAFRLQYVEMEINKANLTDKIERVVLIGVGLSTLEERREREYV